jgi:hypothetical protein
MAGDESIEEQHEVQPHEIAALLHEGVPITAETVALIRGLAERQRRLAIIEERVAALEAERRRLERQWAEREAHVRLPPIRMSQSYSSPAGPHFPHHPTLPPFTLTSFQARKLLKDCGLLTANDDLPYLRVSCHLHSCDVWSINCSLGMVLGRRPPKLARRRTKEAS